MSGERRGIWEESEEMEKEREKKQERLREESRKRGKEIYIKKKER